MDAFQAPVNPETAKKSGALALNGAVSQPSTTKETTMGGSARSANGEVNNFRRVNSATKSNVAPGIP
jgi:hypothetical protein